MWPNSYFPRSYWSDSYFPKTGGPRTHSAFQGAGIWWHMWAAAERDRRRARRRKKKEEKRTAPREKAKAMLDSMIKRLESEETTALVLFLAEA